MRTLGDLGGNFKKSFPHQIDIRTIGHAHIDVPAYPCIFETPVGHLQADKFSIGNDHRGVVKRLHDRGADVDFFNLGPETVDLDVSPT